MATNFDNAVNELKSISENLVRNDPSTGEQFYEIFERIAQLSGDERHKAMGYRVLGNSHLLSSEFSKAIEYFDKAADIYNSYEDRHEAARAFVGKIYALSISGNIDAAEKLANDLKKTFLEFEDIEYALRLDKNLAMCYRRKGNYEKSLSILEDAETLVSGKDDIRAADIYGNKGHIHKVMGEFRNAREEFYRAKAIYESLELDTQSAKVKSELANLERRMGNLLNALRIFQDTAEYFQKKGMFNELARNKLRMCNVYLQLNLLKEGLDICREVIPQLEGKKLNSIVAPFRANAGILYRKQGKLDKAARQFFIAKQLFSEMNDSINVAKIKVSSAVLEQEAGKIDDAAKNIEDALKTFTESNAIFHLAWAELQAGKIQIEQRNFERAGEFLKLAIVHGEYSPNLLASAYLQLGKLSEKDGDIESAKENYNHAIEAVESVASSIANDIFQSSFLAGDIDVYEAPIEFYIKQGDVDSAFQLVERTKSRTLAQLISQGLELEKISESPLLERIRELKEKLNSLYSTSQDKSFREITVAQPIKKEIVNVERKIKELFYQLNSETKFHLNPILFDSQFNENLKTKVMNQLNSDTIILEYYFVNEQLFLFLITASDFDLIKCHIQKDELYKKLNKFNFRINDARYDRDVSTTKIRSILKELYDLLIPPILEKIENFTDLIIIPHSILHNFPFHLLYDGTSYLLERYTISYAPSTQILNFCYRDKDLTNFREPGRYETALIMAYNPDDIPYVVQEAEFIKSFFPQSKCFVQQDAVVSNLKEYAPQSDIIHLSVHGQFREDNPLFSSLQFAPSTAVRNSNPIHDYLTVHDIYYLDINSTLVTLSGCQTGNNFITAADELMGLARGFFAAGATSILASLWSVEDAATTELMKAFYQNIKEDKSFGQALREAQLMLMEKYEHPFYWGGFVLMGGGELEIDFSPEMVE